MRRATWRRGESVRGGATATEPGNLRASDAGAGPAAGRGGSAGARLQPRLPGDVYPSGATARPSARLRERVSPRGLPRRHGVHLPAPRAGETGGVVGRNGEPIPFGEGWAPRSDADERLPQETMAAPAHQTLIWRNRWRPLGDSNPCFRRERATSWTARRRGQRLGGRTCSGGEARDQGRFVRAPARTKRAASSTSALHRNWSIGRTSSSAKPAWVRSRASRAKLSGWQEQ